jgi:xanthine/uracil/vitamin C permease (AzgA family)
VTRRRRGRFVRWTVAWLLCSAVGLSALGLLSVATFAVAATTGLLVVVEVTEPSRVSPQWRSRLGWFVALGVVVVAAVAVRRLLTIVPVEVLPWP